MISRFFSSIATVPAAFRADLLLLLRLSGGLRA